MNYFEFKIAPDHILFFKHYNYGNETVVYSSSFSITKSFFNKRFEVQWLLQLCKHEFICGIYHKELDTYPKDNIQRMIEEELSKQEELEENEEEDI